MPEKYQSRNIAAAAVRLLLGTVFAIALVLVSSLVYGGISAASAEEPTPTPDRLAEPPLSEEPTQYEHGTWLYWYHCMACHGDIGQGLTDEFIDLWPEDHRNCWGRGCHGGRMEDEGFPIPKTIPAVIDPSGQALKYAKPDDLYQYLVTTHPPQNPGFLTEEEYWAIAAFLLIENGELASRKQIGPDAGLNILQNHIMLAGIGAVLLVFVAVLVWINARGRNAAAVEADQYE